MQCPDPDSDRPLNALVLMPLAEQRGGSELALAHLFEHGRELGVTWWPVFFEDGPMVAQARRLGLDVEVIPAGRLRQPLRMGRCVRAIADLARRTGAGVILSWMGKAHLYGGLAARLAGVPAGWFQHGMPVQRSAIDALATLLPAAGVLTCSRTVAAAQERLWPRRATRVVYPAVELKRFDPDTLPAPGESRRRLGLPAEGPLVGIVGRLQRWKGLHVLVEAMPRVLAAHPDARCVLVGGEHALEPDYPDMLRRRIESLGLGDRVSIVGLQRNVPEWMQAMDVFVHASHDEPFGMVVIEAMALGKAVVATDSAGPAEIISPGIDGLLTPFGDDQALAAAVIRFLDDRAFMRHTGEAARRRAHAFSAQRFAGEIAQAVRDLARGGFAARAGSRHGEQPGGPWRTADTTPPEEKADARREYLARLTGAEPARIEAISRQ